jgi:TetR/AcrR family transcriptional regulator, mexJK operon transcriptional repressor
MNEPYLQLVPPMPQEPRRGGRPTKEEAEKIEGKILDAAAALFFSEGYGATSVEEIARRARISKRTFYARYANKPDIFRAVVRRIISSIRPAEKATDELFKGMDTREVLYRVAPVMLRAALSPDTLALFRIVMAESARFPELAPIMYQNSAREEAIRRIAELLQQEAKNKNLTLANPAFAAEQLLFMVTASPQRRALGLGAPMSEAELDAWSRNAVDLFLNGVWGRSA